MASFCLATGISPTEYKRLTITEHRAFQQQLEEMNKE